MTQQGNRRSLRLKTYNYAWNGAYFVTICTFDREHLFGEIVDDAMHLNGAGSIVENEWLQTAVLRPNIKLDCFVVMPNHFHGILVVLNDVLVSHQDASTQEFVGPAAGSLGAVIRAFKSSVTNRLHKLGIKRATIWQRNYHDHIVRNEADLQRLREYVEANPARWKDDRFYAD